MEEVDIEAERQVLLNMEVIVHSTLPSVGGRVTVATDAGQTVDSLITAFCIEKGIQHKKVYILINSEHDVLENTKTLAACDIRNGEVLFITTREISEEWPCGCNQWWLMAGVALLIGCTGIIAISIIQVNGHKLPLDYGVVIDAGSSHSGLFVYKWPGEKDNGTGLVSEIKTCNAKPGISNFTSNPTEAGKSLDYCLDKADDTVPTNEMRETPLYLGATAGMRLLEHSDNDTCQEIMKSVRTTMSARSFNFTRPEEQARIITGSQEGVFSWVTVNYLMGNFGVMPPTKLLLSYMAGAGDNPKTIGALDLGGASTQISFVPENPEDVPEKDKMQLSLYGHNYSVYTHSYLCYGVDQAHIKLLAHLVTLQPENTTITNPCGPKGNITVKTHSEIFEVPCTLPEGSNKYLDTNTKTVYTFQGSSNPEECKQVVNELFNTSAPCEKENCTFDGVFQPPVFGQYKAFSSYYYTTNFFNASDEGSTQTEFRSNRNEFCKKTWEEIRDIQKVPADILVRECFNGFVVDQLLTLYGFNENNWDSVKFVRKIGDATVGWSLGFMLLATNIIPADFASDPLSVLVFVLLIVLFLLFIALAVGFACFARRKSKRPDDYKRLSTYGTV